MFKNLIKQRRQNDNIKYNDLSEMLDDAIDRGLDMNESEKIGNCLLAYFAGKIIYIFFSKLN